MATKKSTPEAAPADENEIPLNAEPVTEEPGAQEPETENTAEPKKRGRGRPAGSTKSSAEKPRRTSTRKASDVDALAHQLVGIHQLAAMATGLQELVISPPEGLMLAKGLNAVAEEYGLALSGKTGAAIQLIAAGAMIYVPRFAMVSARMKKEKEAEQNNIVDMGGVVVANDVPTH